MLLIAVAQTNELTQLDLVFGRDVDGREVAAAVKMGEVQGIDAIGLAAVAGLSANKRGRDDVAMEAIVFENPVEDEAGPGGLVARPHGPMVREAAKEAADLHEVARKADDLRTLSTWMEDGGRHGILVNIEADAVYSLMAGYLLRISEWSTNHSCSSGRSTPPINLR